MENKLDKSTVMDLLAEKSRAHRERARYARSHIKNHRPRVHSDKVVSEARTMFLASKNIKGFDLALVARYHGIKIATLRNYIYYNVRKAKAAQVDESRLAYWAAIMSNIIIEHRKREEVLAAERRRIRERNDPFTVAEVAKFRSTGTPMDPVENALEYQVQEDNSADEKLFAEIDAIIGRAPANRMESAEAVSYHCRQKAMSTGELISIRNKYNQHHSL